MIASRWLAKTLVLCAVAGASFGISSLISSKQSAAQARCQMNQGVNACMVTDYLQLTPEQSSKISSITEEFCTSQRADGDEMLHARTRLLDILKAKDPKRGDVDAALEGIAAVQAKMQRRTADYILKLKPELTDDQQKKLFDLVGQRFCEQGRCGRGSACPGMGMPGCGMRRRAK